VVFSAFRSTNLLRASTDSGGLAYVINDDLYNAYQRRT
jgi:hypothetical protein